jgi:hypothetical protein
LVVPSGWHRLDARAYQERYPDIKVLCPLGARQKVEQVVDVSGSYDDFPANPDVTLEHLPGVADAEGVMVVHSPEGATIVFNDLVFNMPHVPGLAGLFFRYVNRSTGGPCITRMARWLIIKDKQAVRAELKRLADTPGLDRVIVSHHQAIVDDPAAVLRRLAASL